MKTPILIVSCKKISFKIAALLLCMSAHVQAQKQTVPLEVTKDNGRVCMRWEVAEAVIPKMFLVEKSTDGMKFEAIGMRETTSERVYSFCDETPGDKIAMYRIMKVESKSKIWTDRMNEVKIIQYTNSEQVTFSFNNTNSEKGETEQILSRK
jgi:hypothetical protein